MQPRTALALAATGLAIGAVATASGPAIGTHQQQHKTAFTLLEVAKSDHFLNLNNKGAAGDEFLFTSTIYYNATPTKERVKVGTDAGVCTLVAKNASQCEVTLVIHDGQGTSGQITAQGVFTDNGAGVNTFAITGGTQSFYGLTGQVTATDVKKNLTRLDFDVIYPTMNN
jgi:hypothetical protein